MQKIERKLNKLMSSIIGLEITQHEIKLFVVQFYDCIEKYNHW
jgi:Tfp pilus assembly PilM family ATPase